MVFILHLLTIRLPTKISTAQKRMTSAVVAPSESTFYAAKAHQHDKFTTGCRGKEERFLSSRAGIGHEEEMGARG